MSPVLHAAVVLSLLLSCVQAPFYHTHAEGREHEPGTNRLHFHFEVETGGGLQWRAPGEVDGARMWDWVVSQREEAPEILWVDLPVEGGGPEMTAEAVVEPSPRTHSPPPRNRIRGRAPPADFLL